MKPNIQIFKPWKYEPEYQEVLDQIECLENEYDTYNDYGDAEGAWQVKCKINELEKKLLTLNSTPITE